MKNPEKLRLINRQGAKKFYKKTKKTPKYKLLDFMKVFLNINLITMKRYILNTNKSQIGFRRYAKKAEKAEKKLIYRTLYLFLSLYDGIFSNNSKDNNAKNKGADSGSKANVKAND